MKSLMQALKILVAFVVLAVGSYVFVQFYPYIFAKEVDGVLTSSERVQLNVALMQTSSSTDTMNPQFFSFAVAIRTDDGEIITASAEDRQWAAAQIGRCVTATFYPYPPWRLEKSGTYSNARLDRMYECPERAAKVGLPSSPLNTVPAAGVTATPVAYPPEN